MRRLLILAILLLYPTSGYADSFRVGKHIASTTTTNLVVAVAGKHVQLNTATVCMDNGGSTGGFALSSTAGTNIFGTSVVWSLAAGQCITFPPKPYGPGAFYGNPTAAGTGLDIITSTGAGPYEVYIEAFQQ